MIVGGAELFTGNNLLAMAWASRRITLGSVARNWGIVYAGNLVGALGTAVLVVVSGQYRFGGDTVGAVAMSTALTKVSYEPLAAFTLGILCNGLVCLAVWLTYSARTTTDRILAIVPPIAAFVAMGFEHSVANMYFIPVAMLIRAVAPPEFWASIGHRAGRLRRRGPRRASWATWCRSRSATSWAGRCSSARSTGWSTCAANAEVHRPAWGRVHRSAWGRVLRLGPGCTPARVGFIARLPGHAASAMAATRLRVERWTLPR